MKCDFYFELDGGIIRPHLSLKNKQVCIIGTNHLTKFDQDRTRNVASGLFTRFLNSQIKKTAPPTGSHVFQRTRTTFELNQHIMKRNILTNFELDRGIIGTKLLTKFHEDRKRNKPS
ncbi:hypothetical protein DPMN_101060 [Dreissena polymorpha]|uniref:Uncharacterized protein n=1 Tax=Dreissena polymorpha TaxID=45954 RepID=A0A9D4R997_DREPO|nr:hypothetical protein DPMN_101060 [Dreissena polymorpha]